MALHRMNMALFFTTSFMTTSFTNRFMDLTFTLHPQYLLASSTYYIFQKTTPVRCSRKLTRTSIKKKKKVILGSMVTLLTNSLGYLVWGKKREGFPNFSHPLIHFHKHLGKGENSATAKVTVLANIFIQLIYVIKLISHF